MATIKVHDKSFETYLADEVIQKRIKELAETISNDYKGRRPLFIAILNGSFMFAADLFKYLTIDSRDLFYKAGFLQRHEFFRECGYFYWAGR